MLDKALIVFACAILLGANVTLYLSGWVDELPNKPAPTGLFVLDLLLNFFPELFHNAGSKLVMEAMNGFAGAVIAGITFEGARRGLSPRVNALFMPVAQFVAIGFATPFFFALISRESKQAQQKQPGKVVSYTVFFTLVLTGALGVALERSMTAGDLRVLLAFLILPVVTIPLALLASELGSARDSLGAEEMSYQLCFFNGVVSHWRIIYTLLTERISLDMFNAPSLFLAWDLAGLVLGAYAYYLFAGERHALFSVKSFARLLAFGPGGHISLLCLDRLNAQRSAMLGKGE